MANSIELEKWAEVLGESKEAELFKSEAFKKFGKNNTLEDIAEAYSKDKVTETLSVSPCVIIFVKALKPFWNKQSGM